MKYTGQYNNIMKAKPCKRVCLLLLYAQTIRPISTKFDIEIADYMDQRFFYLELKTNCILVRTATNNMSNEQLVKHGTVFLFGPAIVSLNQTKIR